MKKKKFIIIIAILILAIALIFSIIAIATQEKMNIASIKAKYRSDLLSIPGVTGISTDKTHQKIIVYIEDPKTFDFTRIPLTLEGFKIEFKKMAQPHYEQSDCDNKNRPLTGGVCIGINWVGDETSWKGCGTLGAVVKDINTHQKYLLTNRHVITDPSDNIISDVRNPCDFGGDVIGQVYKSSPKNSELVDGALVFPSVNTEETIKGIGAIKGVSTPEVGMSVKKYGMKTGLTYGTILATDYDTVLGGVEFVDQILISRFSESGDSGSLVLDNDNNAVGLHFAGSEDSSISNKISNVKNMFNIYFHSPDEGIPTKVSVKINSFSITTEAPEAPLPPPEFEPAPEIEPEPVPPMKLSSILLMLSPLLLIPFIKNEKR